MIRLPLVLLVLVTGCATYVAIESGTASVGNIQVQTASEWTSVNPAYLSAGGPDGLWTKDGTHLNYVLFYDGVRDGETLFKAQGDAAPYPLFRATMAESEVGELIADSIKRFAGANEIVLLQLAPATFAGHRGFAAELSYTGRSELDYRAYVSGAVIRDALYLIIFNAPRLHFYAKDLEQVRQIVDSAKVVRS